MLASVVCYFSANGYLGAAAKEPANKSLAFSAWPKDAICFVRRLAKATSLPASDRLDRTPLCEPEALRTCSQVP